MGASECDKAGKFSCCHKAIFPKLANGVVGKQFGRAGTSNDWTDPDGKMEP